MGKRRRARELAMKVLFHLEFNDGDPESGFRLICDHFGSSTAEDFSKALVLGVCENKAGLDRMIKASSKHWRLERMSRVDRNILRMGVFEILFLKDVPPKVAIDEAVELAKKYGTEESGAFINGVMDDIYNRHQQTGAPEETDKET